MTQESFLHVKWSRQLASTVCQSHELTVSGRGDNRTVTNLPMSQVNKPQSTLFLESNWTNSSFVFVELHSYTLENQGLVVFGSRENGRESESKKEQRKSLLESNY